MEFFRVTGMDKAVTDPALLSVLTAQGIAGDGVSFERDYARCSESRTGSPYGKYYRDLNSGRRFLVCSGLPMVDAYGQAHELEWRDKYGVIENGNNLFHAVIKENGIRLVALSDQPCGLKKDTEAAFYPQLFIGGSEVKPLSASPRLLETDPFNNNYHNNVLEWDYGICKRRVRLVEGRFLGSWVFLHNPGKDVLIKYNRAGGIRLRLSHALNAGEEFLPREYFQAGRYPVIVADSAVFYPDAHPETSTVDGRVWHSQTNVTWASLIGAAGTNASDADAEVSCMYFKSGTESGKYNILLRSIFLFNVSLPVGASISAVDFAFYGTFKADQHGAAPDINIYSSNPASNTSLAAGDFDSLGSVAFCDTPVAYSSWNTAGYNNFSLNAAGIASIPVSGLAKLGLRNANYDAAGIAPLWVSGAVSYLQGYYAEQGAGYKPKLIITYSTGELKTSADGGGGAETIAVISREEADVGAGNETALATVSLNAGDAGDANENALVSGQENHYLSGNDAARGAEIIKMLIQKSAGDLKLPVHLGEVVIPHKELNI